MKSLSDSGTAPALRGGASSRGAWVTGALVLIATACAQKPANEAGGSQVAPTPAPAPALAAAAAQPPTAPGSQPPANAATACGELSQPMCPLQGWMNRNLQKALDAQDLAAVARALQRVPALVPDPSWNDDGTTGWSSLARAAASAAQAGDLEATKQACKTCHRTWRKQYKDSFRLRAVAN